LHGAGCHLLYRNGQTTIVALAPFCRYRASRSARTSAICGRPGISRPRHREPNRVVQGEARCPQRISGKAVWSPAYGCAGSIASAASRWPFRSVCDPRVKVQRRCRSARRAAACRRGRMPSRIRAGAPPAKTPIAPVATPSHASPPLETSPQDQEREFNRMPRVCGTPVTAVVKGDQDLSASDEGVTARALWPRPRTCRSAEPSRATITRLAPRERHRPGCHGESAEG